MTSQMRGVPFGSGSRAPSTIACSRGTTPKWLGYRLRSKPALRIALRVATPNSSRKRITHLSSERA
jgi:hypothetical protein